MATVDRVFAENIIRHNGFYNGDSTESPDNPRCVRIVEYTNAWGSKAYGAVFERDLDKNRYQKPTDYIRDPKVIWAYEEQSA